MEDEVSEFSRIFCIAAPSGLQTLRPIVVMPAEKIPMPTIETLTTPIATTPSETTPIGTIPIVTIPIGTTPMEIKPSGAIPIAIFLGLLPQCADPSD